MIRVLLPPGARSVGDRVQLEDAEIHHLRVRRAAAGDALSLRDGVGLRGSGRLGTDGDEWSVDIESIEHDPRPPPFTLAVGAGDRERFGWLVEKCGELGVGTVIPIQTERTRDVATRLRGQHVEKLRRQARDSIKQSDATWAPLVGEPVPLSDFLGCPRSGTLWLADQDGRRAPVPGAVGEVTVLVGPEGGLTPSEREAAVTSGFAPVAFGSAILRFETAAIAAAVIVSSARAGVQHD